MAIEDRLPPPPLSRQGPGPDLGGMSPRSAAPASPAPMAAPPSPMAPPAPAGPEDVSTPGGVAPTEQEQHAYDNVVVMGVEKLDAKPEAALNSVLSAPGDKARAAGRLVAGVAFSIDEESGGAVPDDVVIPAAAEIGEQFADRLSSAGVEVDNAFLQRGTFYLMEQLGQYYGTDHPEIRKFLESVPQDRLQSYHDQEAAFFAAPS